MADHYYLTADCKSKHCTQQFMLMYLGQEEGPFAVSVAYPLRIACPECHHTVEIRMADTRVVRHDSPPPPGFEDATKSPSGPTK